MTGCEKTLLLCVLFLHIFCISIGSAAPQGSSGRDESCTTSDKEQGTCMDYKRCISNNKLIANKNQRTPENVEYFRKNRCGWNNNEPKICCPNNSRPTSVPESPSANCGKSSIKKEKVFGGSPAELGSWPWMVALGYRRFSDSKVDFRCGASLISNEWIVTAAHCVTDIGTLELVSARLGDLNLNDNIKDNATPIDVPVRHFADFGRHISFLATMLKPKLYNGGLPDAGTPVYKGSIYFFANTVIIIQWTSAPAAGKPVSYNLSLTVSARLGDLNLNDNIKDNATPIDVPVNKPFVHPEYKNDKRNYDIALIRLSHPVDFTPLIQPICVYSGAEYEKDEFYKNKSPFVAGWGIQEDGSVPTQLMEVAVKMQELTKCSEKYAKIGGKLFTDNLICAGEPGKDACQGDSGGPLMFVKTQEARFYLGGIVSAGKECGTDYPGLYTKVAKFTPWINEVTGLNF